MLSGENCAAISQEVHTHSVQLLSCIKAPSDRAECGLKSMLCTWHKAASWRKGHLLFEQRCVCMTHFFSDLHKATKGSHVSLVAEDDSYLLLHDESNQTLVAGLCSGNK